MSGFFVIKREPGSKNIGVETSVGFMKICGLRVNETFKIFNTQYGSNQVCESVIFIIQSIYPC